MFKNHNDSGRQGRHRRAAQTRKNQPQIESLEERQLLSAVNGGDWVYPGRVTYSLIPDGTSIGGTPSALFSTLNQYSSTSSWETTLAKAFAAWEDVTKVNLVQVSDDGSAVGSGTDQQGASNFGDIRIGAMPEPSGELAFAFLPPPKNGGSAAGDIIFNSNVNWGTNGYDLATVAIHEIGHSLGLDHSSLTSAAMYAYYNGTKQSLTTDDVSGIQSVYGARSNTAGNTSASHATSVALNGNGQATLTNEQISAATDADWYSVIVPQNTNGSMTITIQSSNLSLLEPRVTVYNGKVTGLAQASVTSLGGTATVTINGVTPGQTYYLRASAASTTGGTAGGYGLLVNFTGGTMTSIAPQNTTVAAQANQGGGTSADTTSNTTSTSGSGGGLLGGLLGGVLNLAGGLVDGLVSLLDGGIHLIQLGSLSAYAEALKAVPNSVPQPLAHHAMHVNVLHPRPTRVTHHSTHVVVNLHSSSGKP